MIDLQKNKHKQVVYDNGQRQKLVYVCQQSKDYPDLVDCRFSRPKKGKPWTGSFMVAHRCLKEM